MLRSYKRKSFLINKKFQLDILAKFFFLSLVLIVIFYSANLYFFYRMNSDAVAAGLPEGHVFYSYLGEQKSLMDKIFICAALLSLLVITVGGIFLSHKVAGPLYRLTRHLTNSTVGNVAKLSFRKGDYFPEIEAAFNKFINKE